MVDNSKRNVSLVLYKILLRTLDVPTSRKCGDYIPDFWALPRGVLSDDDGVLKGGHGQQQQNARNLGSLEYRNRYSWSLVRVLYIT